MQFTTALIAALATLTVSAAPVETSNADLVARGSGPICQWISNDWFYVSFAMTIPAGNIDAIKDALKKSSACSGFSGFKSASDPSFVGVGFSASDFCTADAVSKTLKAHANIDVACTKYTGDGPGLVLLPPGMKREAAPEPAKPKWVIDGEAEMKKMKAEADKKGKSS